MPEPIAVAFVELRPDPASFRTQTEAEIKKAVAGSNQITSSLQSVGGQFDALLARNRAAQAQAAEFIATQQKVAAAEAQTARAGAGLGFGRLGAQFALITAGIQLVRGLSDALRVSGNEATTTEGRFRNFGASLISGDILGAFGALRKSAHDFSLEELQLVENNKQLADSLKAIGLGASIAKSQIKQLQGLAQIPAQAQERVAETRVTGSSSDQLSALQEQGQRIQEQIKQAREIGKGSAELNKLLAEKFKQLEANRAAISQLKTKQQEGILAGLAEAVTDATLAGDARNLTLALLNEKAILLGVLIPLAGSVETRTKFKNELKGIDKQLEQQNADIAAEIKRHRAQDQANALAPSGEAITNAQLSGNQQSELAALQTRKTQLQKLLGNRKLDRDNRITLKNEEISVNHQIEAIETARAAEAKRHADALREAARKAHQALLDSFSLREQSTEIAQERAAQRDNLAGQRKAIQTRIALFREEAATLTGSDAAAATLKLIAAENELTRLNKDAAQARIDANLQRLRDNVTLAGFTEKTIKDDERALKKLIVAEARQAHNQALSLEDRRKHLIAQKQAEKDLRDLIKKDDGASFARLSFEFLKTQKGFASTLAGNLLPPGSGGVGGSTPSAAPSVTPSDRPPSPFGPATQGSRANALRVDGGRGASSGQLDTLIHLTRRQIAVLTDVKRGLDHPEAAGARKRQTSAVETSPA